MRMRASGRYVQDVLFAEVEIAEDGAKVHQHFREAHEGNIFVMFDQVATCLLHKVAAPAADGSSGVLSS